MDAHASVGHAELEIPYNVHPRPDTGLYNGKLGVWLFLASEVMLFGALFSSLILLRTGAESWPRGYEFLNVKLATFNTFILILVERDGGHGLVASAARRSEEGPHLHFRDRALRADLS